MVIETELSQDIYIKGFIVKSRHLWLTGHKS